MFEIILVFHGVVQCVIIVGNICATLCNILLAVTIDHVRTGTVHEFYNHFLICTIH